MWQNRYYSCPLGRSHLSAALAYVDLNPVRAGLVDAVTDYSWSSAAAHLSGRDETGLMDDWSWSEWGIAGDWGELLASPASPDNDEALRYATHNGVPLGGQRFVDALEARYGRRLRRAPTGPAPRGKAEAAGAAG